MPNPENIEPHKFQEGQSGNPKGRPKGARSMTTILREMLETEIETDVDGEKVKMQFQDAIIRKLLQKASKGEIKAITEIFDRIEGKAKQELSMNVEQTKKDINALFPPHEEGNQS